MLIFLLFKEQIHSRRWIDSVCVFCILSGKKEERICQKMTIRTTIRKNDCISQSPVSIEFQCWTYFMPSQALKCWLQLVRSNKKCFFLLKPRTLYSRNVILHSWSLQWDKTSYFYYWKTEPSYLEKHLASNEKYWL